jgi:anti-sigma regulatory factor (Ser/Thr protein kinase)
MTAACQAMTDPSFSWPRSWPRQTHLELGAYPTAPACARGHARSVALEWGLPGLADTAELLASELVTNAVQASCRLATPEIPVIRLWLACDQTSLMVHVWDASHEMPARQQPDPDDESGRGLMIIDTLAARWGSYETHDGKVVWAAAVLPRVGSGLLDRRSGAHRGRMR